LSADKKDWNFSYSTFINAKNYSLLLVAGMGATTFKDGKPVNHKVLDEKTTTKIAGIKKHPRKGTVFI
jgi:hypothetical protein